MRRSATSGIPTSLRTPVVRRARRCARKPRSSPLQRSSASPIAVIERLVQRDRPADERQARAAVVHAQRARREHRVDELAAAVEEAARVTAGCAVLEIAARSPRRARPRVRRRSSSASRRRSRGASGKTAARAAAERARCPESGSAASKPERSRISARAVALRDPEAAALTPGERRRSSSPSPGTSGVRSPRTSASTSSSAPGGAARSAAESAWPLPRRGRRRTIAPAASARSAVASREPSSATITSASGNELPQRRRPSRAIVVLLVARGDEDRRPGQPPASVGRIASAPSAGAVLAAARAPASRSASAARPVVWSMSSTAERPRSWNDVDRGLLRVGVLDADRRNSCRRDARRRGRRGTAPCLPAAASTVRTTTTPSTGCSQIAVALADELLAERLPERRLPARRELAAERVAEVLKLVVADVLHELRALVEERVVDVLRVHRHGERDRPRHRLGAGVCSVRSIAWLTPPSTEPTKSTPMRLPARRSSISAG